MSDEGRGAALMDGSEAGQRLQRSAGLRSERNSNRLTPPGRGSPIVCTSQAKTTFQLLFRVNATMMLPCLVVR